MEVEVKRAIPHDKEAEQSVIGSMLMNTDAIQTAMDVVNGDDFYNRTYGILFDIIVKLYSSGTAIDPVIVQAEMKKRDLPAEICSPVYIIELINSVPTSVNVGVYAKIVKDKACLRELIKITDDISSRCYYCKEDVDDIMGDAEKKIFKLAQNGTSNDSQTIQQVMMEVLHRTSEAAKNHGSVTGIPSGFSDLDYKTAGFQKSDLILVAARPSMGKTAFALNIAQYVAVKKKIPVAIFSLEMSNPQLGERLVSMESRVDAQKIRIGKLDPIEWKNFFESAKEISDSALLLDDTPGITPGKLRSKCLKFKLENPDLGLIIIDYLQLMSSNTKSESRQNEISEISRSLKEIARELDVPIIALSQLSRAVEKREDKRPMLSDLRESGAIEQDADMVMFLYREDYYIKESKKKNVSEVIIAKQRRGPIGTVELVWLPQYTKFVDMAKRPQDQEMID